MDLKSFPNWARDVACYPKKLKDAQRKGKPFCWSFWKQLKQQKAKDAFAVPEIKTEAMPCLLVCFQVFKEKKLSA